MADVFSSEPAAPNVAPTDFLVPGSGAPVSTLKPIDPNAKLKLAAQDPFAGLQEVPKPDAFSGLEEVKPNDAFAGLKPADSLDLKDVKSLTDDDTFRPADYLAANPNLRTDAEKSKKLIDVYRARQIRGLEAVKVAKAAVTEAPGIVAKTVKGVRDLGARIIETAIQPAATSALATLTGATPEEKSAIMAEQGKQQLKAVGEVTAGTESAVTGLAQLGQQGMRKLFGKSPSKMSDSELLDQLYIDSEFSKTTKEVAEGRGDAAKAAGLDADTLAKNGVTLDKDAIENLSLVDPLTLVATAGAFKVVGLGGRVIATAATRAGAQTVITGLGNLAKTVGAKTIEAAGKTAEAVGKTGQAIAEKIPAKSVGFILGATKTGTLQGGAVGAAAGEAAKRIGYETAGALGKQGARVAEIGSQLNPGFIGPRSAGLTRLASLPSTTVGQVAKSVAGGAVQGAVTTLPLAAAADESQTAGALLGGGAALGAIHGAAVGGKAAVAETVAKNYLDPHNIPFEPTNSPGYGVDAALDKSHDAAIAKLPEQEQNAVNTFREAVRAGGGEIYVQDGKSYGERVRENQINENGGKPLTPEQEKQAAIYTSTHAFFDGYLTDAKGEQRRVVFLNSDATGLPHDAGHLFHSLLSPENQAALRDSALSSYSKEQLQAFKDEYTRRIGVPDYFDKLGDQADAKAADELIAENFGQLFQNKTFADLSAPRSFLKKLGDTAVQAGEALGLDLTAGRITPDLGAKPSFRLQDLLRNAAQDVLTREPSKLPVPEQKPLGLRPEDVARREANAPVTKEITPELVKLAEPSPAKPVEVKAPATPLPEEKLPSSSAKNIRVTRPEQQDFASKRAEETGIAEAQKATEATPEVRKVVDDIAASMNAGNPVLEVEHRGIVSEKGPAAPEGRTSRRGTQEAGYQELERLQIENRKEAPADIVDTHQKTFVPVRFTTQGGKPTLLAMSLDKVIANVRRVTAMAFGQSAEKLIPYPTKAGKLTDAGWKQAVEDVKSYAENQSNGYRGDGQKLVRPTEDTGVSLPAENPEYKPVLLSEPAMNFANLVQGLAPPETGRVQKGLTPGNVKGQLLAEVNKKQPMRPAVIKPENVTKQGFKGFEPREVAETNPLRNELAARGVNVRELTEVTERLAVQDIASVKPRPELGFKAPVTDIIRAGFLPRTEAGKKVAKSGIDFEMTGDIGNRSIRIKKDGHEIGDVTSSSNPFTGDLSKVIIAGTNVQKSLRGKGIGEAAYRELLTQLKEDGVKEVGGMTVSGAPLAIREKIFGKGSTEVKDVGGSDRGTIPVDQAISELNDGGLGFEATNKITTGSNFLPGNETDRALRNGQIPDPKPSHPEGDVSIRSLADTYMAKADLDLTANPHTGYDEVNVPLAKKLAEFYDNAKDSPEDPKVKASYRALADETLAQAQAIKDAGYTIEPYTGEGEPYKSSAEMVADVRDNKHLYFLKTEGNFSGNKSNPMLKSAGDGLVVNDVFRAVHDFFGHAKEGYQFGPRGELNAWKAHAPMFSGEAQGALAAETLAQNSWVNYGKHLKEGTPLKDRPFAEQKSVVVPADLIDAARKSVGESAKFLPSEKSVAELGPEVAKMSADDWRKFTESNGGHLTPEAFKLGLGLKDKADLELLRQFQADHEAKSKEARGAKDYDAAMVEATKSQFFREAVEAATDTGSAANPRMGWRNVSPDAKPPFAEAKFLPKKRNVEASDVRKRETVDERMAREIGETDFSKYDMPKNAPKAGPATGWILPNQEFVPLDAAFHEQFLAENSAQLNEKFGTKFGGDPNVEERLDALNKGFVRVRSTSSTLRVELAAAHWTPKTKKAILNQIEAQSDNLDKLHVTLLDKKGGVVDSIDKSVVELDGPEKLTALSEAVGSLRGGAKFLPQKISPESLSDNPDKMRSLWLSPKGELFDARGDHQSFIKDNPDLFSGDTIDQNIKGGWVRVTTGGPNSSDNSIFAIGNLNKATRAAIEDLHFSLGGPGVRIAPDREISRSSVLMDASGPKFLPSEEGTLPGMKLPSVEKVQQDRVKARVNKAKDKFPEALPPRYEKDDAGKFILEDGKPKPILEEYRFAETPVAREAAKGLRGDEREDAITTAIGDKLVKAAKVAAKNPDIQAGATWYSTTRSRLKKLLGDDTKFFSELLGATSARTPVETNFRFALDAYNQFKRGAYDELLKKYREGKDRWDSGETDGFPTRAAFMDSWIQEHNLTPLQGNGKKFAMNSRAVLKVLDGSWAADVQGPKTPNFAGNLSGSTFEATIDVWASRLLHRLANEGNDKPWRILPENETGLSDADFALGQKIFRKAADKLGMKPDALQAILWFAEKDHWERNGWTRGAGAEKSDFNSLLKETELTPSGVLKRKTPQLELLSESDVTKKP